MLIPSASHLFPRMGQANHTWTISTFPVSVPPDPQAFPPSSSLSAPLMPPQSSSSTSLASTSQTHKVQIHSLLTKGTKEHAQRPPSLVQMLHIRYLKATIYRAPHSNLKPLTPTQRVPALLASFGRYKMVLLKRIIPSNFLKNYYLRDFIYFQTEGKGGREGEKYQCEVASRAPPPGDLSRNPGMCPGWESNR